MTTLSVEQAQARLLALIAEMRPGDEVVITQQDRAVARLIAEPGRPLRPRRPGSAIGKLTILEDDDAHLEDFREYMP
jgi:antitoxin (DNA-binding transcriptional repressor) of toxin-antitoxin stability system